MQLHHYHAFSGDLTLFLLLPSQATITIADTNGLPLLFIAHHGSNPLPPPLSFGPVTSSENYL